MSTHSSSRTQQQASADYVLKGGDDLTAARRECIAEFGISGDLLADYRNKIFKPEAPTPCYIRCVFERLGLFEREKGFNVEYYLRQLGREGDLSGAIKGAFDYSGTDTCFWAYRTYINFREKGLLPADY